jgi:3-hydroxyisobutyrate dehydrogenase-like beta-hydroxyacid dehydrogenase
VIAFLGLGHMGLPMARRLVVAGHPVTVWSRTPTDLPGARSAADPAAAVEGASLVITMLRDPEAVRAVLAAARPAPGTLVVEMSTIGPAAVAGLRELLPDVRLVDAPVLGSTSPAEQGTLTVLVGGEPADVEECREVLAVFGTVRAVGGSGAGAALKLAVMSAVVPAHVLLAETLAYADELGVDRDALLDALAATPLGVLVERARPALAEPPPTRYGLGLAAKDLSLRGSEELTLAAAARRRLEDAVAAGFGEADLSAVLALPKP